MLKADAYTAAKHKIMLSWPKASRMSVSSFFYSF